MAVGKVVICMNERDTQRLERISEKMAYMKAQRQDIIARDKKRQRKERTRRLIQIGALAEKYFELKDVHPVEFEKFLQKLMDADGAKAVVEWAKKGMG